MSLVDSLEAIGAVTDLLSKRLPPDVSVGRPEAAAAGDPIGAKLNLFLYEIEFDGQMRNFSLDEG